METKDPFVLWLGKFKYQKDLFVNSEYRFYLTPTIYFTDTLDFFDSVDLYYLQ